MDVEDCKHFSFDSLEKNKSVLLWLINIPFFVLFVPLNPLLKPLKSTYNAYVYHQPIQQQLHDFTVLSHFINLQFVSWDGAKSLLLAVTEISPKALEEQ